MSMPSRISRAPGFTLVEVLVSIAVLGLLVALIGTLFNNTSAASSISTTHLEADARVRLLFARMASDFSHILKRKDIDYYLKSPSYLEWPLTGYNTPANLQTGTVGFNDQMAFFSHVAGYSYATDPENAVSLVAYRVNNTGSAPCIERLGTALAWGGGSSTIFPLPFLPQTISMNTVWQAVESTPATASTSDSAYDPDFETIVPNAFRFEYYYLLNNGTLSATPYTNVAGHTALNGLQDVVAIGVAVAITDRKSSAIAASTTLPISLPNLATTMADFSSTSFTTVGQLQASWQNTVNSSSEPTAVKEGIRIYEQLIPINTPAQ
jgi:prepilin-type N-terminal cleavage/methylation domain-containing protein